jgi:hypothetical protein
VTLECAAGLPNSEAEDVVNHIEAVWQRGKLAIDVLRDCLGPELRDTLCPLRNEGVSLHKLYGVMHDTCNCANKVWQEECFSFVLSPHPYPKTKSHTTNIQRLLNLCLRLESVNFVSTMVRILRPQQIQKQKHASTFCVGTTLVTYQSLASTR